MNSKKKSTTLQRKAQTNGALIFVCLAIVLLLALQINARNIPTQVKVSTNISKNSFRIVLVPLSYFKEITQHENHMIENLKIFYVPYIPESDRLGITFYKSKECYHRDSD